MKKAVAAALIAVMMVALAACDNFNRELKPDIEYYLSHTPVDSWGGLAAAVAAVPPGGSTIIAVMRDIAVTAPVTISGGRNITVELYRSTREAVIRRGADFTGAFFDIQSGQLVLGGGEYGTPALDGGAAWNAEHTANSGLSAEAPLVTVAAAGALTVASGAVLRNNVNTNAGDSFGGGIYVSGGAFTMNGGTITGNNGDNGGGVQVAGGSFTMYGGNIAGNITGDGGIGGGVFLSFSSFIMHNGNIADNDGTRGGGIYVAGGSFTMDGGNIRGNTAAGSGNRGGGVCLSQCSFTMDGGNISDNAGDWGGGAYVDNGCSFTMTDGEIGGNTATGGTNGGGVFVSNGNNAVFSKSGGTIYGDSNGDSDTTHTPGSTENTATGGSGHAVYLGGGAKKRNDDADPSVTLYARYVSPTGWTYVDLEAGGLGDTELHWQ
ncbi:MAG: hypothetical protein LBQ55_10790 [Treponema sp.]|nr:hypothetical protein [Treponema sp.]